MFLSIDNESTLSNLASITIVSVFDWLAFSNSMSAASESIVLTVAVVSSVPGSDTIELSDHRACTSTIDVTGVLAVKALFDASNQPKKICPGLEGSAGILSPNEVPDGTVTEQIFTSAL